MLKQHADGAGIDIVMPQGCADIDLAYPADKDVVGSACLGPLFCLRCSQGACFGSCTFCTALNCRSCSSRKRGIGRS